MSGAKILVVEDERITAEDLKAGLEFDGYQVPAICSSGEDAVQKAGKIKPDLVLMDIRLEGEMDGIEAAGEIRRLYDIPVIYLTAYSDEKTVERAKKTEPSGFLVKGQGLINKPFEDTEIRAAIEITLYRHHMEKEHHQLFSAMLRNVSEAVISTDPSKKIRFINNAAEKIIGRSKDEVLGKNLDDVFFRFNPIIEEETSLEDALSPGETPSYISPNGSEVLLEGTVTPLNDNKGEVNGMVIIFRPQNGP
ncbi:MAG TPA: response regulator [Methanobacteriaceae archaeon]|nr:response regulator [Euryarchaeota archaeon]HNR25927.1 response regulator [Methanobacteriaceae archaeon]HNS24521.1 response regulator [Methanobacteriaceae archaeon]